MSTDELCSGGGEQSPKDGVPCRRMQKLREPSHLPTVMIHKEIPGVLLFPVGDLQTVGMSYLLCLEGGVQVLDVDDSFGGFTLEERKTVLKILMAIGALWSPLSRPLIQTSPQYIALGCSSSQRHSCPTNGLRTSSCPVTLAPLTRKWSRKPALWTFTRFRHRNFAGGNPPLV